MLVTSPSNIRYPITVTELCVKQGHDVKRTENLFSYTYEFVVEESVFDNDWKPVVKAFAASFPSDVSGKLSRWNISKGSVIKSPGVPIAEIEEPCKHEIQWGSLCASCGQDMTEVFFTTTTRDTDRAPINMAHGHTELRISKDEASRVGEQTVRRLLETRKLSLVVDLDQTIIHATDNNAVREWKENPWHPNHHAVSDIGYFSLPVEQNGKVTGHCWYYIKPRPGLQKFLKEISEMYELHIYTMGSRAYARNVVNFIDPERKYFGDRVLSRDENGTMFAKTLQRLFPSDTKMVAVIDDRGDVWDWHDNLVKVIPYEFFIGTGDINSDKPSKSTQTPTTTKSVSFNDSPVEPTSEGSEATNVDADAAADATVEENEPSSEMEVDAEVAQSAEQAPLSDMTDVKPAEEDKGDSTESVNKEERLQEGLADHSDTTPAEKAKLSQGQISVISKEEGEVSGSQKDADDSARSSGLRNDDDELSRLEGHLRKVHTTFYSQVDRNKKKQQTKRVKIANVPDVAEIMFDLKEPVLDGVILVFTGIIPLGKDVLSADISRWAQSFGAIVLSNIDRRVTHVIAAPGLCTAKVKQAHANPSIEVVTVEWLYACFSRWERVDVGPFQIKPEVRPEGLEPEVVDYFSDTSEPESSGGSGEENVVKNVMKSMASDWDAIQAEMDEFLESSDEDKDEDEEGGEEDGDEEDGDEEDGDEEDGDDDNDDDVKTKAADEEGQGGEGAGEGEEEEEEEDDDDDGELERLAMELVNSDRKGVAAKRTRDEVAAQSAETASGSDGGSGSDSTASPDRKKRALEEAVGGV